jgi:L-methionine (R)-S-oxide reductase
MPEILVPEKNVKLEDQYLLLIKQIKNLLNKNDNVITNLANLSAALKQSFKKISWVGFYLFDGEKLYLGPFQGKVACTEIEIGKGVCGISAQKKESIIVPDVDKFSGHIACDVESKSEIVIPIIKDDKLLGVLDLDSADYNAFDYIDKKYLEEIINFLSKEIL